MRRLIALVLTVLGVCSCGSLGRDTHVLRIANWGAAGDDSELAKIYREILEQFERENPGVEIQIEGIPGSQEYVSKVLLSFVAGAEPDIITLDASSAAVFIENDVLLDLAPLAARTGVFSLDDYFPNVVNIARRGKKLFAIPLDFTPMVMYYNKDLFDAAGVSYPKAGWTTTEFLETARRLTGKGIYGFKFVNWIPGWLMWLWNRGGDILDATGSRATGTFDSKSNAETVAFLRDLVQLHKVAPSLSQTAAAGVDPFANGTAAMEVSGHWALVGYKEAPKLRLDRIGVAPLPSDVSPSKTVIYESGLAIGRNCRNPELAWKFIQYYTSYRVQHKYQSSGIAVCARKDVSNERATDEREQAFLSIVPSARPPWGSRVVGYDLVEDIGQKMMDAVIKGGADPMEALRDAARKIDRELARK